MEPVINLPELQAITTPLYQYMPFAEVITIYPVLSLIKSYNSKVRHMKIYVERG